MLNYLHLSLIFMIGVLFGIVLMSLLVMARRSDDEMMGALHPVAYRGRPSPLQVGKDVSWHYTDGTPANFPEWWQIQALGVIRDIREPNDV